MLPHFTKDPKAALKPINARAETVTSSGMFQGAFAARRCIVPADLFYEWQLPDGLKQPMAVARADAAPLAFGALWEGWRSPDDEVIRSFAIVTTSANREMAGIHNRMPLVLGAADWPA